MGLHGAPACAVAHEVLRTAAAAHARAHIHNTACRPNRHAAHMSPLIVPPRSAAQRQEAMGQEAALFKRYLQYLRHLARNHTTSRDTKIRVLKALCSSVIADRTCEPLCVATACGHRAAASIALVRRCQSAHANHASVMRPRTLTLMMACSVTGGRADPGREAVTTRTAAAGAEGGQQVATREAWSQHACSHVDHTRAHGS